MARLTVITIALNEEMNIAPCLESVRWADEIIVVDSGSTDRTVEQARRYTSQVFSVEWQSYGVARNFGLSHASGDWILWLDADERVTPELAAEIKQILERDDRRIAGYAIARRAYFLGRWIKHCGWYPSRVVRLFQKQYGKFTESRVHEKLELHGETRPARFDLLHFTDPNLHGYLLKFNKYTSLGADDLHDVGRRFRYSDVILRPVFQFFKMYLLRRGFLDGMPGFILCVLSSAYVFTKYAKLWEREQNTHA
jgi:glycosyltransferase involved in cell wall biosynthesis